MSNGLWRVTRSVMLGTLVLLSSHSLVAEEPGTMTNLVVRIGGQPISIPLVACRTSSAGKPEEFFFSRFEVTQEQFFTVMSQLEKGAHIPEVVQKYDKRIAPKMKDGEGFRLSVKSRYPMVGIDFRDAVHYCKIVEDHVQTSSLIFTWEIRLPSLNEWQIACQTTDVELPKFSYVGNDGPIQLSSPSIGQPAEKSGWQIAQQEGKDVMQFANQTRFVEFLDACARWKVGDETRKGDELFAAFLDDPKGVNARPYLPPGKKPIAPKPWIGAIDPANGRGATSCNKWQIWDLHGNVREIVLKPRAGSQWQSLQWVNVVQVCTQGRPLPELDASVQVVVAGLPTGVGAECSNWRLFSTGMDVKQDGTASAAVLRSISDEVIPEKLLGFRIVATQKVKAEWVANIVSAVRNQQSLQELEQFVIQTESDLEDVPGSESSKVTVAAKFAAAYVGHGDLVKARSQVERVRSRFAVQDESIEDLSKYLEALDRLRLRPPIRKPVAKAL